MTLDSPRGGEDDGAPSEKQMTNRARPQLMCEACGHIWSPRNTAGASRHCSKCDSKQIIEVSGDNAVLSSETATQKATVVVKEIPMPPLLKDDPDIRQKMKDLELVKLDRQIREAKGGPSSDMVLERLVINHIELLFYLKQSGAISDKTHGLLISSCPWCGASGDEGLSYEDTDQGGGYRCTSCQHWVPY